MIDGNGHGLTSLPDADGEAKLALCRDCNWGGRSRNGSERRETHAGGVRAWMLMKYPKDANERVEVIIHDGDEGMYVVERVVDG